MLLIGGVAVLLGNSGGSGSGQNNTTGNPADGAVVVTVRDGDWSRGDTGAPVTLIEYADFECPACAEYAPIVKQLLSDFPGKLRQVYRFFPLINIHPNAIPAAKAAEAAGKQGKFWEMGDMLFAKQQDWADSNDAGKIFEGYAKDLGLDVNKFKQDVNDSGTQQRINTDLDEATKLNLSGTPTFFINGRALDLPGSYDNFKKIISEELAKNAAAPTISASVSPTPSAAPAK